jgi:hypothetical protein
MQCDTSPSSCLIDRILAKHRNAATHNGLILFGSAVIRLLETIFGTSLAIWTWAKYPSGVKITIPFGFSPNGRDLLPSGAVISAIDELPGADDLVLQTLGSCACNARLRAGRRRRKRISGDELMTGGLGILS